MPSPSDDLASEAVAELLTAATRLAAAGLEYDDQLDPDLRINLLVLAVAVTELERRIDLEQELAAEDARSPVAVVPDDPEEDRWGWVGHVDAVVDAANLVVDRVLSPAAQTIPAQALVYVDGLCDAVLAHRDYAEKAARWREMGGALSLVELGDRAPELAGDPGTPELDQPAPELEDDR